MMSKKKCVHEDKSIKRTNMCPSLTFWLKQVKKNLTKMPFFSEKLKLNTTHKQVEIKYAHKH